jgi:hypothetical protein
MLVALGARSYQPFGGEPGGERTASTAFLDSVFTVVLVLGAALAVLLLWVRLRILRRPGNRTDRSALSGLVFFLIFITLLTGGRALLQYERRPSGAEATDAAFPQQVKPGRPVPQKVPERAPRFMWPLAIGLGALIAAIVVIVVVIERRRSRDGDESAEALEELAKALDEAIEDLRRDPDPRRAVVAAYARMEQALSVYGLPRRPAETPYEYLARVARQLEAEGPVASLTELFEVAKFSEHSVDEGMRGRAIDALTAVRREVRAAT